MEVDGADLMENEHTEIASAGPPTPRPGTSVREIGRDAASLGMDRIGPTKPASAGTKRLTANLPLDAAEALAETTASTGFNQLATIVRAIRVFADLIEASSRCAEGVIKKPTALHTAHPAVKPGRRPEGDDDPFADDLSEEPDEAPPETGSTVEDQRRDRFTAEQRAHPGRGGSPGCDTPSPRQVSGFRPSH